MNIKKIGINTLIGATIFVAGYLVGDVYRTNQEDAKHEDDQVSISVDYYGRKGERVNVFGKIGGENFGLLDVTKYSDIRNQISRTLPDSLGAEEHFKTLDSMMNAEVEKDLQRYPYSGNHFKAHSSTGYDFRVDITK